MTAVTEKDAATKWCPFGRIGHVNGSTCNSPAHNDPDLMQTCIGSRCMAWRHLYTGRPRTIVVEGYESSIEPPPRERHVPPNYIWDASFQEEGGARWREPDEETRTRDTGYCGLVGSPA